MRTLFLCLLLVSPIGRLVSRVELGIDLLFQGPHVLTITGKKVALVINHTSRNSEMHRTEAVFLTHSETCTVRAIFTPEHGFYGSALASEPVAHSTLPGTAIPMYSLHGETRRPTSVMLNEIDVIVFDIQDIGVRSYTYASTLFYIMEEAAQRGIKVIVLDRPNPLGGILVDGPMVEEQWRSFVSYLNLPYCHGLTIGELAHYFNQTYQVGCPLEIVKMQGWTRNMSFADTGLCWIPTSPNIPEPDTPLFYASTGILGSLNIVNIGVGYTLPYKVVGAPWIDADLLATCLNAQHMPGVHFLPFHYRPFYGSLRGIDCHGVQILIQDPQKYRPLTVQYMLIGILKSLYPKQFMKRLAELNKQGEELFCKVNGNNQMLAWLKDESWIAWKMIQFQKQEREAYLRKRKKFLLY